MAEMFDNTIKKDRVLLRIQRNDVHRSYSAWYICRCYYKCRGILKCQHIEDRTTWSDRIRIRYRSRCPVWKTDVRSHTWQGKSADRFSRSICRTYGSPCISESRSGSRSDQLPSDACNGTERSRSYRNSRSSRNIYGYFRSNVATGSDLLACKGKSRLLSKCQTVPSGTEGNRQVSLALRAARI